MALSKKERKAVRECVREVGVSTDRVNDHIDVYRCVTKKIGKFYDDRELNRMLTSTRRAASAYRRKHRR